MIKIGDWLTSVSPGAGASVMGTAILSIGYRLVDLPGLSLVLFALACADWLMLAGVFVVRFIRHHHDWRTDADLPASLTAAAATAVLGSRFAMVPVISLAWILLAIAVLAWVVLLPMVARAWRTPTVGASFLVCVATQCLAVLGATLAASTGHQMAGIAGGALFLLGLVEYLPIVAAFDRGQVRMGAGDHWVAGGALSISALAGAQLAHAHEVLDLPRLAFGLLRGLTLFVLVLALAWYLVLAVAEIRWPRPHYDMRRWSTVFPLGMTAVACVIAGQVEQLTWLRVLGHALLYPALAVWALVGIGTLRRAWQTLR